MAFSESIVRYLRRIPSIALGSGLGPDTAEIGVCATTNTLQFNSAGQKEVVDLSDTQTITGNKTMTGTLGVRVPVVVTEAETVTLTAADSGTVYLCTASSGTQVFTLPAAATGGLTYTFICGHASGEINVGVGAIGDNILGKIHASNDGTALVTTTTSGLLLNTASGNVIGDMCSLVSDGVTSWYMTAETGVWSAT